MQQICRNVHDHRNCECCHRGDGNYETQLAFDREVREPTKQNPSPSPHRYWITTSPTGCRLKGGNLLKSNVIRFTLYGDLGFSLEAPKSAARRCYAGFRTRPVEGRPGICLASRRNIAMAYQPVRRESRVRVTQRGDRPGEGVVLLG